MRWAKACGFRIVRRGRRWIAIYINQARLWSQINWHWYESSIFILHGLNGRKSQWLITHCWLILQHFCYYTIYNIFVWVRCGGAQLNKLGFINNFSCSHVRLTKCVRFLISIVGSYHVFVYNVEKKEKKNIMVVLILYYGYKYVHGSLYMLTEFA